MRFSLTGKLLASFLALTALVLAASLGLARWSFERGFLDYVNTLDHGRLERVADDLIVRFTALGNRWEGFDEAEFDRILYRHRPPTRRVPSPPDGRPLPVAPSERSRPVTALFDLDGRRIAGPVLYPDPDRFLRHPILADGQPIGKLHAVVHRGVSAPADTDFSRQQGRRSLAIGAFALLLATLVSWLLSRALLAPVRASIASIARLSAGDLSPPPDTIARARGSDELARLARDLEHLRMTLETVRSARRRLLADVSHELRTPLTILSGEIVAMRDGVRSVDDAQLHSLE